MTLKRVAFVVQRCGDEVIGGAESLCLQVAERLRETYDVEVLTTCALDYQTWRNAYPAGHCYVRGVHVRRFPVDRQRNMAAFNRLSREITFDVSSVVVSRQEEWMRRQGPLSSGLFAHIMRYQALYDAFVFFGYLYATTYFGLPPVAHKAILVPFAHDEWPIRMSMWERIFAAPAAIVYSSEEEREFLRRRFLALPARAAIIGAGIEPPERNAERFRERFGIEEPFLLYLGRVEKSKGVDVLFEDFARYREARRPPRKLVLVGRAHTSVPKHPDILCVGQVDEGTKWDALAACDLLVMPSQFESLSLAILEAWGCGKPVLVNARSSVLVGQCRRAQGGIWYDSYDEFETALDLLDRDLRAVLGRQGQEHVQVAYNWKAVICAYGELLEDLPASLLLNGAVDAHERQSLEDTRSQ